MQQSGRESSPGATPAPALRQELLYQPLETYQRGEAAFHQLFSNLWGYAHINHQQA